ncbi:hypothetical protein NS226_15350 [Aureimonas ureilytica]|uniref:Uncharacterized protein n=2 Tax=Aureimonas ureilytica TaxID=401562 RepID=A0A175R641_9HYPH|nr:hypothetical protein NS226_15350 [Aureimonas ureilytica]
MACEVDAFSRKDVDVTIRDIDNTYRLVSLTFTYRDDGQILARQSISQRDKSNIDQNFQPFTIYDASEENVTKLLIGMVRILKDMER